MRAESFLYLNEILIELVAGCVRIIHPVWMTYTLITLMINGR